MSHSSASTGLNRTRSLRQPNAGLGSLPKTDEARKDGASKMLEMRNESATASTSTSMTDVSQNMSPSKLPKPGASTAAAAAARARARAGPLGLGATTATTSAKGTTSRPTSGVFGLSRLNPVPSRKSPTQNVARDAAEPVKNTRRIPTTTTRLTRPKSMIAPSKPSPPSFARPSSSSRVSTDLASPSSSTTKPKPPHTTTHTRARSTATSLTSTTALRPPESPPAGSTSSASTTAKTGAAASKRPLAQANTATTRAAQQRQASVSSAANNPALSTTSSTTATRPPKQSSTGDAPRLRPAFNTLQQHYSPARNLAPKPLTSTYLAPPTPSKLPANVALSSETAKIQTELLQLHLLHRDADTVTASWHASARERLGRKFEELAQADAEVGKKEAALEEACSLAALESWARNGTGKSLDDKIQTLDGVLTGLWSLSEPGGRHAHVVRKFEKWAAQMMAAVDARRKAGGLGALMEGDEVAFIGELDPTWKEEVSSLARKLDEWRRHLTQLEAGLLAQDDKEPHTSSLVTILAGCRSQVYDMLAELTTMEQIEQAAFSHEAAWIKRINRDDAADDTPGAGAIWRAFG